MIFFLIYFLSFILLSNYSYYLREMSFLLMSWFKIFRIANFMPSMKKSASPKVQRLEEKEEASLLDLPDLALECILERLSPAGLSSMAGVCSSLRDWCRSDHLWEKHMKQKWGKLIGDAAYRKWQIEVDLRKRKTMLECSKEKGLCGLVSKLWPFSSDRSKVDGNGEQSCYSLPVDSIMAWYLSLEGGKFLFPAQVYNRENGNVGFMLSCYDAELSYDSATDTFKARYSSHGRPTVEDNIEWSRLRAPAVDTPAHVLHVSDCLNELRPGDPIEIQWRRNKDFPYGWWYGVVGHLEPCDGNDLHCWCHFNDTVVLEFKQYTLASRWRQVEINRKEHREVGDEAGGFYGGIRKLHHEEDILTWKRLWPTQIVE